MPHYVYNPVTMLYDELHEPKNRRYFRIAGMVLVCLGCVCLYAWLYLDVLGWALPKTAILRKQHAKWEAKMELLDRQLDLYDQTLDGIESRDDDVYRSIFGLAEIPDEIKHAGFGGVNRYEYLDRFGANAGLKETIRRIDVLTKRTYVQSKALDEVLQISAHAGDMLSCVPSVPPLLPDKRKVHLSSSFGGRIDPVFGGYESHTGQDFAVDRGYPVYATGDGTVVYAKWQSGYGNLIEVDHGFGYVTRYAHLSSILVRKGQKICRGAEIGLVGSTGKSTGPHLHYEVIVQNKHVNPINYYFMDLDADQYDEMISLAENHGKVFD